MTGRIVGRSMAYVSATLAPIFSSFLLTPLVIRLLGPQSYGIVALSVVFSQFGIVVLTLGLAASITRQAIINRSGSNGAAGSLYLGTATAVVVFIISGITLPTWGSAVYPGPESALLIYPLVSALGLAILQNSQSLFRAADRVAAFVVAGMGASILGPVSGLLALTYRGTSPESYLLGQSMAQLGVGLGALLYALIKFPPLIRISEYGESLKIGLPTVPHQLATNLMTLVLVAITGRIAGLPSAGAVQLGMLIGSAPSLFLGALNNVWAPMMYKTAPSDRQRVIIKSLGIVMLIAVGLFIGFGSLASVVTSVVAGKVGTSYPVLQIAVVTALGTPFMALYLANIHFVFLSGKTMVLAISTPVSAAVGVVVAAGSFAASQPHDIRLLALGVPAFQASQWMISTILRQRASVVVIPTRRVALEAVTMTAILAVAYFVSNYWVFFWVPLSAVPALWLRRRRIMSLVKRGI